MITAFLLGALVMLNMVLILIVTDVTQKHDRLMQRLKGMEDWRSSQLLLNQSVGQALVTITHRLPLSTKERAHIETLKARVTPGPERPQ